jgi:hypothetical protein
MEVHVGLTKRKRNTQECQISSCKLFPVIHFDI